ncbi:helix-turn-helix domain-containing protein [Pseudoclavibacter albus]|uniref:helix-turn-helix domain-containing protein n=1 Tax=Pseudoclavibacter albus TaxID=272241 RepID=UPI0008256E04|nr:helix-turn-helix transcriptional regulator [Pseudoclavibacter alba]
MTIGLYYYTLAILLMSVVSAAMCVAMLVVTRRRIHFYGALGLCIAFLDVGLTFRTDFMGAGREAHISSAYDINGPIESFILAASLVACMYLVMLEFFGKSRLGAIVPTALVLTLSPLALLIEHPMWREYAFFSVRDLAFLSVFICAAIWYFQTKDKTERLRIREHRQFYWWAVFFTVATLVWNTYFLVFVSYDHVSLDAIPFLPERNFAENALLVTFGVQACHVAVTSLRMRYEQAPKYTDDDRRQEYLRRRSGDFGKAHGLSARETEVLFHLVSGKDNKEIAETLFLAVSTVKVHIHHILAKTGHSNRVELTQQFWSRL